MKVEILRWGKSLQTGAWMYIGFRRRMMRSSAFLGLLVGCALPAYAADATYQFDIPAESLDQALTDFSQASSQQIFFSADQVKSYKSTPLHGRFTATNAVSMLLAGTDLKAEANPAGVLMVQRKNVQAAQNDGAAMSTSETSTEAVVVTGTHIRGAEPVGSPVTTYTRQDIDKSGASTVDQFARTMTQNFSSADSLAFATSNAEFARVANGGATDNAYDGASFNIHGLGATATLTLLNGLRLAPAGENGLLTDMSLIPLSAVDHIDVIADGASAIYGADAVSGVVNIVTRKDFDGFQTNLRYGVATEGGAGEFTGSQLFGTSWGGREYLDEL